MTDIDIEVDTEEIEEMLSKTAKQMEGVDTVLAGYFEGRKYPDGDEVAEVALAQEYGVPNVIPARPFISNAETKNHKKWEKIFSMEMDKGKPVYMALGRVGEEMRNDIIREIDSNLPPPNSEKTIKKKKSSHTLIDTGNLKRSTAYELKKGD